MPLQSRGLHFRFSSYVACSVPCRAAVTCAPPLSRWPTTRDQPDGRIQMPRTVYSRENLPPKFQARVSQSLKCRPISADIALLFCKKTSALNFDGPTYKKTSSIHHPDWMTQVSHKWHNSMVTQNNQTALNSCQPARILHTTTPIKQLNSACVNHTQTITEFC